MQPLKSEVLIVLEDRKALDGWRNGSFCSGPEKSAEPVRQGTME